MSQYQKITAAIQQQANPSKALFLQRFFKTGPGEYAAGDRFLGLTVPQQRIIARQFRTLPWIDVKKLLRSYWHEYRLIALIILVDQFQHAQAVQRAQIVNRYLQHTRFINNWDLVDLSADKILGTYLLTQPRTLLVRLAKSKLLWERRIAMIATFAFIKQGDCQDALHIAELLVHDQHDLIQKAVGWMLREVGKRCSRSVEEAWLQRHYRTMPRTMLRYAIEQFPVARRRAYLAGTIKG